MLIDEKIFTVFILKNLKKAPTVHNCSNQEERHHDKTITHVTNIQT